MRKPGAPNHPFLASSLPGCLIKVSFLFFLWGGTAFAADAGLRDDWVDPETGHRVTRLSRLPGESQSFYFHQNAFTREGDKMVFSNTGTNRVRNLFVLDWRSRKLAPLTDGPDDVYRTSIQIAELNALNAALAIVRFKQVRGFYTEELPITHLLFGIGDMKLASQ